jgi:hypothetical protein
MNSYSAVHLISTSNAKESIMKNIRSLFVIAFLLCSGGAFASDNTLQVVISVTIATVNEIEWAAGTNKDNNRNWTLSSVALNTPYVSATDGTMTESGGGAVAVRATALDVKNRNVTPISLTITATTAVWSLAAAVGTVDQFKLEASLNRGGVYLAQPFSGTVVASVAGLATQTLDLQLTTPVTVTTSAAGTCTVTITSAVL